MSACDDFLAGSGRLAALLRELPSYEPPASLDASFLASAQNAQASVGCAPRTTDATAAEFEAPASLEASFLKMAASIDAAQAPRREALLAQIASGEHPQAVLGADIQPVTTHWLQEQAGAAPAKLAKPARQAVFLGFSWFDLRVATLTVILSALATQWVLKLQPDPQQVALQALFHDALEPRPPTSEAELARAAEHSLAEAQIALDEANAAAPPAPTEERELAKRAAPAGAHAQKKSRPAEISEEAATIGPPMHLIAPINLPPGSAIPAAPDAHLLSRADPDSIEAPAGQLASPEEPLRSRLAQDRPGNTSHKLMLGDTQAEAAAAPAPASPAPVARQQRAAPLPAAAPLDARNANASGLRLEAQPRISAHLPGVFATLEENPASVAKRLPALPAGLVWKVFTKQPDDEATRRYLELLRQSMPAANRPARFELIHESEASGTGLLRILPPTP